VREADALLAEAGDDLVLDALLVEAVDPEAGASAGTESMSVLSWLVPRLPIQPAWR
jgi:hypothetical protein